MHVTYHPQKSCITVRSPQLHPLCEAGSYRSVPHHPSANPRRGPTKFRNDPAKHDTLRTTLLYDSKNRTIRTFHPSNSDPLPADHRLTARGLSIPIFCPSEGDPSARLLPETRARHPRSPPDRAALFGKKRIQKSQILFYHSNSKHSGFFY